MGKKQENLSEFTKKEIIQKLKEKNVKTVCPMCGCAHFTIADGYFNHSMQANVTNVSIGGPSIPTIAIVCEHCGFVSQHALGILGLIKQEERG
jgi:predicted RNA-binding Zn-ribbon protein involved in translation (DUF1610 family)